MQGFLKKITHKNALLINHVFRNLALFSESVGFYKFVWAFILVVNVLFGMLTSCTGMFRWNLSSALHSSFSSHPLFLLSLSLLNKYFKYICFSDLCIYLL